jgi:threonine dehydrogenase-like Zn-dependent dehydrogenase
MGIGLCGLDRIATPGYRYGFRVLAPGARQSEPGRRVWFGAGKGCSLVRMVRAMVQHGVRDLRLEEFDRPSIGDGDALLRVEACGICGSDYEQYDGTLRVRMPVIPGHEPVGVIEEIGPAASAHWGVSAGDRVAVEALLPCGTCEECARGRHRFCRSGGGSLNAIGYRPVSEPPSLWGGYAEQLYLSPHAIVHRISKDVPADVAVMFNPLGAGFRWAVEMPRLERGETVVILGPGQRGLASVIAAREAGAGCIIVTGLARDAAKLELARAFGAHHVIDAGADDVVRRVREITDNRLADVVVDVTAYALDAVTQAFDVAKRGGRVVLAGTKGMRPVPEFYSDRVVTKELTIMGALGVDSASYTRAIALIESGAVPLERMHTHTLPLDEAERALRILAGEEEGEDAIHIALVP